MSEAIRSPSHSPIALLIILPVLFALSGCGTDFYSETMVYSVRTDPVVILSKLPAADSGREMQEPDRPGQLPLLSISDMADERNPFFRVYENKDLADWYVDPKLLAAEDRRELQAVLEEVFGTPSHPKVEHVTRETRQLLELDETLREGSRLYRQHCLQCHGLTGDGRGQTAKWVNPHPRDYRPGVFKFQSVIQSDTKRQPRREDLYLTIYQGVEGTAMQSYNMLSATDINALVSYVIHLSIRGEVEESILKSCVADKNGTLKGPKGGITASVKGKRGAGGKVAFVLEKWREAQEPDKKIAVGAYKISDENRDGEFGKSMQRGFDIFVGNGAVKGGCTDCHIDFGRKAMFKFDDWGTLARPRDLTKPVYRGGRRPIDLYYRIHSGINGANMPAQGSNLTPDQIWDVVNFVRALPYTGMRSVLKPAIE